MVMIELYKGGWRGFNADSIDVQDGQAIIITPHTTVVIDCKLIKQYDIIATNDLAKLWGMFRKINKITGVAK